MEQPVDPAALAAFFQEKQEQYEYYRDLFTDIMTNRCPDVGLTVLLSKGMKAWLLYIPYIVGPEPSARVPTGGSENRSNDELVLLLATMIGGV